MVVGVAAGIAFMMLLNWANNHRKKVSSIVSPVLPDGIEQALVAVDSAVMVVDLSNNLIRVSPLALSLGLTHGQGIAHQEIVDLVNEVRSEGEPTNRFLDVPVGEHSSDTLHLQVRVAPLGPRYIIVLVRDHTEAQRLEEVRRDFLANVSHELKTPIGSVRLLAEAISSAKNSPDDVERFADRLGSEADRLSRITQEIIELSRLQAAGAPVNSEVVRIGDIVAAALDANQVTAAAKNIELVVGGEKKSEVIGDALQLTAAVHNLIANAIVYSPENSRVGIGISAREGDIEISVTDRGIGIPAEDQPRVFERFYRVDEARARDTGGTGLGLSIVKHIARIHGGDVRLWSQPNRGSTFTIRLPEKVTMLDDKG